MAGKNEANATVIKFRGKPKRITKPRKSGLNRNKLGSVRKINGNVYVDFMYLDERVRESSGIDWNEDNVKRVRQQLDAIAVAIDSGTFRFADVFPDSKKRKHFSKKEKALLGDSESPDEVLFKDYASRWYELLKTSERVSERTLLGYRRYIELYLVPFFGSMAFSDLNKGVFDSFISWAKAQQFRKKAVSNTSINKILVPMKMICRDAAISYDWGSGYNPFLVSRSSQRMILMKRFCLFRFKNRTGLCR